MGSPLDFESILDDIAGSVHRFRNETAAITERLRALTADAWSADEYVHIWVNARGVVIETEIDLDDLDTVTPDELAASITEATQKAARAVAAKATRLQDQLWEHATKDGPRIDGLEQFRGIEPEVSLAPPDSEERRHRTT
ncbi:YbaB/EbfC family nucleoid-associated protein [Gordonia sp. DT30]|uniref:YbaB/EbfC family nucleoid-associated protein n=1 Tax=unclassified Gordonia (in: high G+C Gram-positive bacteria) TaxID=2657482 RepID=UPI003CF2C0FA